MRRRRGREAAARWIALVLLCAPAGAQEAPPEAPVASGDQGQAERAEADRRAAEAKQRFMRGVEHTQSERWDAALAEFLASRELFPTKVALKNAGICLRQLGRAAEALEMYRELVQRFSSTMTVEERKSAEDAMAQLAPLVGDVLVESPEPGATVIVDGRERGTTPSAPAVVVGAGTHTVRVSKEGFAPFEEQVVVAGGQRKKLRAVLRALARSGRLVVTEAEGRPLDVLVDGATVGKAPWSGVLAVGTHNVVLRGEDDVGTPPSTATVRENEATSLTLRAAKLDASLRIEPTPSNAMLFLDGVRVGNGTWEGKLRSGAHGVELTADGFLAHRSTVTLRSDRQELLRVALERDLSNPMWKDRSFVPHVFVEASVGAALSPSLGGSADSACARGECGSSGLATGFVFGGRGGYQLTPGLGLEAMFGYLRLSRSMTRTLTADVEGRDFTSSNYQDDVAIGGPMAELSASYRFFERTPLLFRLGGGAARVRGSFENRGTFTGTVAGGAGNQERVDVEAAVSIPERSENLWLPFVAAEVRFGYQISRRFVLDVGLGISAFFPSDVLRTGRTSLSSSDGQRRDALPDGGTFADGTPVRPGVLSLPRESAFGTFFAIMPTIGGRFDF